MASVTTKSARSLTARSPPRAKAQVTLTTQATVGELIDIPGMDLDALVQETADLAADDIMEEMETQNAGLAPPKRKVTSPRAADFGKRYFDGRPPKELTRMELLMRDTRALRDERRIDREMARKFWCATATGYVLGFLSLLIMVPLSLCWNLGVMVYEALRREKPPPKKPGKVAPMEEDWRYQLKDGFPQRKNAALFDLTHKAKADPRAHFKTYSAGDLIRARPAAAQPSYGVPVRRTEQDDLLESFAADRAKQRRAGPPPG
jgi:hypothetical protein